MANSLFNQFGNNVGNPMSQFMNDFKRLQQTIKNPKQEVENLLQSGRMSQQQFNQLSQMANQLMGMK
ncbi:MAG: hypothetical protein IKV64_02680 [Clostridia bacterium]|nr:hypothetical protein [Clostridia bacterium]